MLFGYKVRAAVSMGKRCSPGIGVTRCIDFLQKPAKDAKGR